jgi:hypothetical protein
MIDSIKTGLDFKFFNIKQDVQHKIERSCGKHANVHIPCLLNKQDIINIDLSFILQLLATLMARRAAVPVIASLMYV